MSRAKRWWERPVRMLRMDYAPDFSVIRNEDLEEVARNRKEDWCINCEWIVGTPGFSNMTHQTTFDADGYEKYPGLENFDYLRSYAPIAHKHGIKVIAYLNMHWFSYEFAADHPDWEQITSSGERYGIARPLYGNGTTFCVNSGWREWAFSLMAEAMKTGIDGIFLDGPVVFHDCCYCPTCQMEFIATYGRVLPRENWHDPLWKGFLCFRENSLARFLADARQTVRKINPEGVIFLNGGGWEPSGWRVARDIQQLGPFQNFNGAEAFFSYGITPNPYACMMTGKYLRAGDKPAVVFVHYMNDTWHYLNLPREEIGLSLAQIASCGANPWLALIRSSLDSQPSSHEPAKSMCGFLEQRKDYFMDCESMAEVGLLFSAYTNRNYLSRYEAVYETTAFSKEENLGVDYKVKRNEAWTQRKKECEKMLQHSYTGYFQALTRAHILFDILLDKDLNKKNLVRYKTIILSDAACLDDEAVEALKHFVSEGGNMVCSFEAGFYDAEGDPLFEFFEVLGIKQVEGLFPAFKGENYQKVISDCLGFKEGVLVERAIYALKVIAAEGAVMPMLFMNHVKGSYVPLEGVSTYPSLIINSYGKGKVLYFPEALGYFYGSKGMPSAEDRIARSVQYLVGTPLLEIDAPRTVSAEVYRQKKNKRDRVIIHLVNNTTGSYPARECLPVINIDLRLNVGRKPRAVTPLRELKSIDYQANGNGLEMHIPVLNLYEVISIDF